MLDTNEEKNGYRWAIVFVLSVYKSFLMQTRKAQYPDVSISPELRVHLFQIADQYESNFSILLYKLLQEKLKCANVFTGFEAFSQTATANPSISFSTEFPGKGQMSHESGEVPVPSWHESLYFFDPHDPLLTDTTDDDTDEEEARKQALRAQFKTPERPRKPPEDESSLKASPPKPIFFSPDTPPKFAQRCPLFFHKRELPHEKASQKALSGEYIIHQMREAIKKRHEWVQKERETRSKKLLEQNRKISNATVAILQAPQGKDAKIPVISIGDDTTCSYLVIAYESRQFANPKPQYVPYTSSIQDQMTDKMRYDDLINFTLFKGAQFVLNHLQYLAIGYSQDAGKDLLMHETADLKNNLLKRPGTSLSWNLNNGCVISDSPNILFPIRTASYHFGGQRLAIGHCNMCAVLAICMGAKKICLNLDSSSNGWFDTEKLATFAFKNHHLNPVLIKIVAVFKSHFGSEILENSELTLTSNAARDKTIRQRWYQGAAFAVQELLEKI